MRISQKSHEKHGFTVNMSLNAFMVSLVIKVRVWYLVATEQHSIKMAAFNHMAETFDTRWRYTNKS